METQITRISQIESKERNLRKREVRKMETKIENCKLENARSKNSKEKEVIRMKRLIGLGLAILLVCGLSVVSFAGETTATVTITVAPVVSEVFTITPNTIALGTVDVNTSTGNVSGLDILNTGTVTLTFEKTVTSITSWTLGVPAKDVFRLKALADASALTPWGSGVTMGEFDTTLGTYNDLTENNGSTQLSLDAAGTEKLWFMLDMPTSVGSGTSQSILVTIKGTSS